MPRPVILKADAEAELRGAVAWYNGQRKGLGRRFAQAVRGTLSRLAKAPEAHAKVYGDVRRALVAGFPSYIVYYVLEPAQVTVFSVFHSSRDPRIWQIRADDLEQS
jgi:plasmid stabilization system protein ParE